MKLRETYRFDVAMDDRGCASVQVLKAESNFDRLFLLSESVHTLKTLITYLLPLQLWMPANVIQKLVPIHVTRH